MLRRVGEVIQATSTSFVAQCYQLYASPPLGGFVHTSSPEVYGVVHQVITEPLDPSRPVLARGESEATEEEVYQNNPQIARLLTSRFETLIIGYRGEGRHHHFLPPQPPRVHSFVYTCDSSQVAEFTAQMDFLHLVVNSGLPIADEVAGACLREAALAYPDRQEFLRRAGKILAAELSNDLSRLNAILRRLTP
jgi:hypothetical protein